MSTINIHLFGRFETFVGDRPVECFCSQKALDLFCFLILFRDRPHHREHLAEIFWGQRCTSEAKKYLRKTLWQLQSGLEKLSVENRDKLIRIEPEWLYYNQDMELWLDVMEFESICNSISGIRGQTFEKHQFQSASKAAQLYRGELLEGCYQDWCVYERERFKDLFFSLIDKLMGYCEAHQDYDTGLMYGRKLLALDWARESTHLRLMRLYHLAGDRTGALRQFDACKGALRQEFNIAPGNKVLDLHRRLTNYSQCALISLDGQNPDLPTDDQSVSSIRTSLVKIRRHLVQEASISEQIMDEIQAIEAALMKRD